MKRNVVFVKTMIFLFKYMGDSTNELPPKQLTPDYLPNLPPLALHWLDGETRLPKGGRADGRLRVALPNDARTKTFVFEYKSDWTARPFSEAVKQAKRYAEESGDLPLVILPYMSDEHLNTLYEASLSGMDLCGNALFIDLESEPIWCLRFTGKPNRFKNTQKVKSPYQGKSGLVARTLLSCPVFPNAEALQAEVARRGGEVSQPVVSRALQAFRDDLVVGSQGGKGVVLLQTEKLLDRLTDQWRGKVERWQVQGNTVLWRGRVDGNPEQFLPSVFSRPRIRSHQLIMTGLTSAAQRTNLTLEPVQYVYSNAIGSIFDDVQAEQTRRFPNFEVWFPPDEAVFFDPMTDEAGVQWASPLQTYLGLAAGDVRSQQAAVEFRKALLAEVDAKKARLLAEGGET